MVTIWYKIGDCFKGRSESLHREMEGSNEDSGKICFYVHCDKKMKCFHTCKPALTLEWRKKSDEVSG